MWHYHTNNKKQLVQKCITTHRYTHTHTHTHTHTDTRWPLCCHADGDHSHEDWWARSWPTCPERKDLLSSFITPTCFFTLGFLFALPASFLLSFSLLSRYFSAAGPFNLLLLLVLLFLPLPLLLIRSSNMGTSSQCHPLPTCENANKTSLLHLSSNKEPSPSVFFCFFFFFFFFFFLHCQSCPAFHLQLAVAGFALINCREFSTQSWGALTDQAKAPWHHWCERRF